jgi:hypothetical protein
MFPIALPLLPPLFAREQRAKTIFQRANDTFISRELGNACYLLPVFAVIEAERIL